MNAISTRGLTKFYETEFARKPIRSLEDLNLEVAEHEVFGFLGRNGAGKTTTIKLLCHLLRPTRGEALVLDRPVRKAEARRQIGYLPETPYFYEYLTPRETIEFYGRLNGLTAAGRAAEWQRLSELLDLGGIADRRIREFSKGMRQRLGFAVALVGDPSVLILDEPMSGLDPMGRRAARELILRLRDEKKTIFFSSHVLSDVEQICDRAAILVQGRLTVQGRLDELLKGHVDRVEVIIAGLGEASSAAIAQHAVSTRISEAGHHFIVANAERGNEVVRLAHAHGGALVEFAALRQSLEDYFSAAIAGHGDQGGVA